MMILLAVALLLLNAFFVAAEFALVKVRDTQLSAKIKEGNRHAGIARSILANLDPYLSATQLGITLSSLGLGWVGEPVMAALLEPLLSWMGVTSPAAVHTTAVVAGFSIISFLHIVIGEIAPKSLALARPVGTSLFVALPMRITYYLFYPFLMLLNGASNLLLRAMGVQIAPGGHTLTITAEELEEMTAESARKGILPEDQGQMLSNVFIFPELTVSEVMVPHNRVFYVDMEKGQSLREVFDFFIENGRSRAPLVSGSLDKVLGVVHVKDIAKALWTEPAPGLMALCRPALYVPENMLAQRVLLELRQQRNHLAIVVDEYGGTSGIVTMEDILEELVGEIQDEFDSESVAIQPTDYGYLIDGLVSLVDLERALDVEIEDTPADTINGLALEKLEGIPQPGDTFVTEGWEFRVQSMEGLRIGKLEVRRLEPMD
ncbi:MAG: HlyC/CorC family transporter [Bacteroidetes bacterium]|nr:HlyC/CorC family transporter [Bacteroidota bacterium]